MKHIKYLRYVIRHKWFVFRAGLKLRVPVVSLILHDWTKFLPIEWTPYVDYFYGNYPKLSEIHGDMRNQFTRTHEVVKGEFDRAWNHHQKANMHHWQYWLLTNDQPSKDYKLVAADAMHDAISGPKWDVRLTFEYDMRQMHVDEYMRHTDWLCMTLNRLPVALPMPERHVREMVADWIGAGLAMGKADARVWYEKNKADIILHDYTRERVAQLLDDYYGAVSP